jgi:DNA-directed RNA polymerase subunit H (RpoH/RPB5)
MNRPKAKPAAKRAAKKKTAKPKAKEGEGEGGEEAAQAERRHYEFDDEFVRQYAVLLVMLLERGYSGDGLIGVEALDPGHAPSDEDLDQGIVGQWHVRVTRETREQLRQRYEGLERFNLRLLHQDARLNMLVYYLIPEVESHGSVQERKQLSDTHVKAMITVLQETEGKFSRLLMISKAKPSADASAAIATANDNVPPDSLGMIKLVQARFFDFSIARWMMQPRGVRIWRDAEKRALLDQLGVAPGLKGHEETLVPMTSELDPLVVYYGARVGELITYVRDVPTSGLFMRIVIPDYET